MGALDMYSTDPMRNRYIQAIVDQLDELLEGDVTIVDGNVPPYPFLDLLPEGFEFTEAAIPSTDVPTPGVPLPAPLALMALGLFGMRRVLNA